MPWEVCGETRAVIVGAWMIVVRRWARATSKYEEMFVRLNKQFPNKIAVKVLAVHRCTHDDAIAHKIEAGSDMFLVPSKYEPCGLNQIYSFKSTTEANDSFGCCPGGRLAFLPVAAKLLAI
jgi:glycogen synthase